MADAPERITRIEFSEILPGRIQWQMWAGDRLNHSEVLHPELLDGALKMSAILIREFLTHAKAPFESQPTASGSPVQQAPPAARGLDSAD